jgi:hypothetical protein
MTFNELLGIGVPLNPHTAVRWKGGGSSTTTESGISEQFKPQLTDLMNESKAMYDSGGLSKVVGSSALQDSAWSEGLGNILGTGQDAIQLGNRTARDAAYGHGMYSKEDTSQLKAAATRDAQAAWAPTNDAMAGASLTGSARASVAAGERDAQLAGQLGEIDYAAGQEQRQNAMWGSNAMTTGGQALSATQLQNIGGLEALGQSNRAVSQEVADSGALGLERYANVFAGLAGGNTTSKSTTSGGGK